MEGWDEALHEIGRLSFSTVLSPENAAALLKSVEDLPVLIVAGAEDALVSLKSAQAMSSKLVNSVSLFLYVFVISSENFRWFELSESLYHPNKVAAYVSIVIFLAKNRVVIHNTNQPSTIADYIFFYMNTC